MQSNSTIWLLTDGEQHCLRCGRMLCRIEGADFAVELKCKGCGVMNMLTDQGVLGVEYYRYVNTADGRTARTPDDTEIAEIMQQRWDEQRRDRAVRSSELSVGKRFRIFERDGFTCTYCGRSPRAEGVTLEVDHVRPRSKGGDDGVDNLTTSCVECNRGKSNRLLSK